MPRRQPKGDPSPLTDDHGRRIAAALQTVRLARRKLASYAEHGVDVSQYADMIDGYDAFLQGVRAKWFPAGPA